MSDVGMLLPPQTSSSPRSPLPSAHVTVGRIGFSNDRIYRLTTPAASGSENHWSSATGGINLPKVSPRTMTPPWRSQGSPSQRVAHEHPSPLRPALATPSVEQPGSTSAAEDELLGSDSVLRRFRMRHAEKLGALSGRSAHASIEEQINELYAWAGYLAHDLERAGARIAAMKEEGTRAEAKHAGLEDHIRFLEWRCSERHISELEVLCVDTTASTPSTLR